MTLFAAPPDPDARPSSVRPMSRRAVRILVASAGVALLLAGLAQPAAASTPPRPAASAAAPVQRPAPVPFSGAGFDACTAPSLADMTAWLASPYRAVGIYIGGVARHCDQPNLTPRWVGASVAMGWHLLPIYVGQQAPCTDYQHRIDASRAAADGTAAATDAVSSMVALGMGRGVPIYYNMEQYDPDGGSCSAAVRAFLSAWTVQLHTLGYVSGVYSSASGAVTDLVAAAGSPGIHEPDAIWFARWPSTAYPLNAHTTDPAVPASMWSGARIHQYEGPHDETFGGVTITIDSNAVDAPTVGSSGAAWTDPPGSYGCQPGSADGAAVLSSSRIAGADRYATAALLAEGFASNAGSDVSSVIVANGENIKGGFDALSAAYAAGKLHAPILLTSSSVLPHATAAAICDVLGTSAGATHTVYVIGGTDSVSSAVADQLSTVLASGTDDQTAAPAVAVSRVAGTDRYATSAMLATLRFTAGGPSSYAVTDGAGPAPTAILASGLVNADALSAGPVSAAAGIPVVLTGPSELPAPVTAALKTLGIRNVIALGGTDRIPNALVSTLGAAGITVTRVAGTDRYDTAAKLDTFARAHLGLAGTRAALANGITGFPDALTAGPYLGAAGGALLLVPPPGTQSLPASSAAFLKAAAMTSIQALGTPSTVSAAMLQQATAAAG